MPKKHLIVLSLSCAVLLLLIPLLGGVLDSLFDQETHLLPAITDQREPTSEINEEEESFAYESDEGSNELRELEKDSPTYEAGQTEQVNLGQHTIRQPHDQFNRGELQSEETDHGQAVEPLVSEEGGEQENGAAQSKTPTITLIIIGPEDMGTILEVETVFIAGETVLDVLKRVTREQRIHMEYRGKNGTAYVEGINNVYEFDYGAESGWLYSVNGVFPNRSAGIWDVEAGDDIRWLYTVNLGRDWDAYNLNEDVNEVKE